MKKMYQKSLRKMRELPKILSKKEWDKYAIQNNEKLFSEKETELILDNIEVFSKIYVIGLLDKK